MPVAWPSAVVVGVFAPLVGGLVSLQAPFATPPEAAGDELPPAAGVPPLLELPQAATSAREAATRLPRREWLFGGLWALSASGTGAAP